MPRFTRDAVSNLSVNLVPIAVMVVFLVLFLATTPFGPTVSVIGLVQLGLVVVPIVTLSVLTYEAAKRVEALN